MHLFFSPGKWTAGDALGTLPERIPSSVETPMPRFPDEASLALLSLLRAVPGPAAPATQALPPDLRDFYIDLHRNPELSVHEEKTAVEVAARLRQAGFEVTPGVLGTGVVGVLKNGSGPTVMLRTELDALPVEEK